MQTIANPVGGQSVTAHNYLYDSMHRRTQATLEDGSLWKYGYNDRNELTSGKRSWSDWVPVAGQQFEYAFDNIGNRTSTKGGGDAGGNGLRSASYGANSLNQYTNRTVPGAVDITGAASATATNVSVNSQACYRKGEYYWKDLSVANGSGPAFPSVTNSAIQNGTTTNVIGNVLVAPANQTFSYDLDGNLTNDSVWSYSWDAENRLAQMTNSTTVPSAARKKLVFGYDFVGRRITKKVYPWSGSNYSMTPEIDLAFVYDGWNLLAEINATNNAVIRSYIWGQDISGKMTKAGGVGALLYVSEYFATQTNHFAFYDGNGNVVGLVNAQNNSVSARYEYSPFGDIIRATGPLAKINPFRWSTKFADDESLLTYYGYRYCSAALGRFLNRDSIAEDGGLNIYACVLNDAVNGVDVLGMSILAGETESASERIILGAELAGAAIIGMAILQQTRDLVADVNLSQSLFASAIDSDNVDHTLAVDAGIRDFFDERRFAAKAYPGLLTQVDKHIKKLQDKYPGGGAPDPNDPRDNNKRDWIKDIKDFIREIEKAMDRMPNNAAKRQPYLDKIKEAEEILKQYGGL